MDWCPTHGIFMASDKPRRAPGVKTRAQAAAEMRATRRKLGARFLWAKN
jgi:hypothetical protein